MCLSIQRAQLFKWRESALVEPEKAVCKIPTKIKNVLMLLPCTMASWTHRQSLRAGREGP